MTDAMKDLEAKLAAELQSPEELEAMILGGLPVGAAEEELSEEDLDFVFGGMSDNQAARIVSTAYWDLCVKKKSSTRYSGKQIRDALEICGGKGGKVGNFDISVVRAGLTRALN